MNRKPIAEVLEKQSEIITLQTEIIDTLSAELLQYGEIEEENLEMMREAVKLQQEIQDYVSDCTDFDE